MSLRRKIKFLLLFFICCIIFLNASAQRVRIPNNPNYDYKPYHFGFMLGLNQMYFIINAPEMTNPTDSLYGIESSPKMGFNIGILANLRINDYIDIRFVPSLSFGERSLNYYIKFNNQIVSSIIKKVESTYIEFPIEVKLRSQRMTNTRAYVLGGAKYCLDLASQAKKKSEEDDIVIKLYKSDVLFELGVGFDFYLVYFKLTTEIKMAYGIKDLLVRENNLYTNSIDRLSSKMFQFSLTFE